MEDKKSSISVIIPAYNEERNIAQAILRTMETFHAIGLDFEIIVINDNSADRTAAVANEIAGNNPEVHVFHHKDNLGSGGAFKTGILHAVKDYVIFVPADNPLDAEDIEVFLPHMGVSDIVVGSRTERVGYSRFALFTSFIYNRILIPLLFNVGLNDVNWISLYRRNLFTNGTITFNSTSLFWLAELLIQARRKHLIVTEVAARMKKRLYGRSTSTRWPIMSRTFIDMIRYFWRTRKTGRK